MSDETPQNTEIAVDRRALLRRGAAIAAGAAGAAAAGVATAPDAAAVDGAAIIQGQANDGTVQTEIGIAGSTTGAALALTNPSGAALNLVPTTTFSSSTLPAGSLYAWDNPNTTSTFSHLEYVHGNQGWGAVNTTSWTPRLFSIIPRRVLDTRTSAGRANILTPGSLDGTGRLRANVDLILKLDTIFDVAESWFGNLTITASVAGGYAAVWPQGGYPGTSNINFAAGRDTANSFVSGSGFEDPNTTRDAPTLRVRSSVATHVIIDITAAYTFYWATSGTGVVVFSRTSPREALPPRILRKWEQSRTR